MVSKKKIFQVFVLVLLLAWYGLFFMQKTDLTTADLGRHIKNGELVLEGDFGILKTNFYSYTEPGFPVVNHHWGGGVVFYLIWKLFGFTGLSLFYLIISLIIFYLFFRIAQKEAGFKIALLLSLFLIPLMTARREIRPEIFSYFFIALFFWILWHWRKKKMSDKWLFVLPGLEAIWVNTHIYFVFGPALVGLFWIERLSRELLYRRRARTQKQSSVPFSNRIKKISLVLILTSLFTLLNPFGIKGLLYPFNIFRNYGYRIVENQSVWFLDRLGIINNPNLSYFKIAFVVLVLSFILLLIKNRSRFSIIYFCLALVFSLMAWLAIRNFTIFAFFALPIIAYNIRKTVRSWTPKLLGVQLLIIVLALAIFLISFFVHYQKLPLQKIRFGFGLMPGNNQSAQFFREQNIQGPIFNNYDIGSYLIYHLYPQEKVFTDNRPEAYSVAHFQDIYIPAQQDNSVWQKLNQEYNFNVIFFSHRDYTPWGQQFLIERVADDEWIPVFVDPYAIIFLKRNQLNNPIIEKYQIPQEYFGVTKHE
jgi:MFS family permease